MTKDDRDLSFVQRTNLVRRGGWRQSRHQGDPRHFLVHQLQERVGLAERVVVRVGNDDLVLQLARSLMKTALQGWVVTATRLRNDERKNVQARLEVLHCRFMDERAPSANPPDHPFTLQLGESLTNRVARRLGGSGE